MSFVKTRLQTLQIIYGNSTDDNFASYSRSKAPRFKPDTMTQEICVKMSPNSTGIVYTEVLNASEEVVSLRFLNLPSPEPQIHLFSRYNKITSVEFDGPLNIYWMVKLLNTITQNNPDGKLRILIANGALTTPVTEIDVTNTAYDGFTIKNVDTLKIAFNYLMSTKKPEEHQKLKFVVRNILIFLTKAKFWFPNLKAIVLRMPFDGRLRDALKGDFLKYFKRFAQTGDYLELPDLGFIDFATRSTVLKIRGQLKSTLDIVCIDLADDDDEEMEPSQNIQDEDSQSNSGSENKNIDEGMNNAEQSTQLIEADEETQRIGEHDEEITENNAVAGSSSKNSNIFQTPALSSRDIKKAAAAAISSFTNCKRKREPSDQIIINGKSGETKTTFSVSASLLSPNRREHYRKINKETERSRDGNPQKNQSQNVIPSDPRLRSEFYSRIERLMPMLVASDSPVATAPKRQYLSPQPFNQRQIRQPFLPTPTRMAFQPREQPPILRPISPPRIQEKFFNSNILKLPFGFNKNIPPPTMPPPFKEMPSPPPPPPPSSQKLRSRSPTPPPPGTDDN